MIKHIHISYKKLPHEEEEQNPQQEEVDENVEEIYDEDFNASPINTRKSLNINLNSFHIPESQREDYFAKAERNEVQHFFTDEDDDEMDRELMLNVPRLAALINQNRSKQANRPLTAGRTINRNTQKTRPKSAPKIIVPRRSPREENVQIFPDTTPVQFAPRPKSSNSIRARPKTQEKDPLSQQIIIPKTIEDSQSKHDLESLQRFISQALLEYSSSLSYHKDGDIKILEPSGSGSKVNQSISQTISQPISQSISQPLSRSAIDENKLLMNKNKPLVQTVLEELKEENPPLLNENSTTQGSVRGKSMKQEWAERYKNIAIKDFLQIEFDNPLLNKQGNNPLNPESDQINDENYGISPRTDITESVVEPLPNINKTFLFDLPSNANDKIKQAHVPNEDPNLKKPPFICGNRKLRPSSAHLYSSNVQSNLASQNHPPKDLELKADPAPILHPTDAKKVIKRHEVDIPTIKRENARPSTAPVTTTIVTEKAPISSKNMVMALSHQIMKNYREMNPGYDVPITIATSNFSSEQTTEQKSSMEPPENTLLSKDLCQQIQKQISKFKEATNQKRSNSPPSRVNPMPITFPTAVHIQHQLQNNKLESNELISPRNLTADQADNYFVSQNPQSINYSDKSHRFPSSYIPIEERNYPMNLRQILSIVEEKIIQEKSKQGKNEIENETKLGNQESKSSKEHIEPEKSNYNDSDDEGDDGQGKKKKKVQFLPSPTNPEDKKMLMDLIQFRWKDFMNHQTNSKPDYQSILLADTKQRYLENMINEKPNITKSQLAQDEDYYQVNWNSSKQGNMSLEKYFDQRDKKAAKQNTPLFDLVSQNTSSDFDSLSHNTVRRPAKPTSAPVTVNPKVFSHRMGDHLPDSPYHNPHLRKSPSPNKSRSPSHSPSRSPSPGPRHNDSLDHSLHPPIPESPAPAVNPFSNQYFYDDSLISPRDEALPTAEFTLGSTAVQLKSKANVRNSRDQALKYSQYVSQRNQLQKSIGWSNSGKGSHSNDKQLHREVSSQIKLPDINLAPPTIELEKIQPIITQQQQSNNQTEPSTTKDTPQIPSQSNNIDSSNQPPENKLVAINANPINNNKGVSVKRPVSAQQSNRRAWH